MENWKIIMTGLILCLILGACFPQPTPIPTPTPTPTPTLTPTPIPTTSAEFVKKAWDAFNNNQFPEAINFAQECIKQFESEAIKQQSALTKTPPNANVTANEQKEVFANWALNDVGTAYFIKGWALQKQGKLVEAKDAYEKAITFPFARCWDPLGWFWSPSEKARDSLGKMSSTP